jgi:hypothetical protein
MIHLMYLKVLVSGLFSVGTLCLETKTHFCQLRSEEEKTKNKNKNKNIFLTDSTSADTGAIR